MSLDNSTQVDFPKLDTPFVQEDRKEPANARIISIPWYRLLIALWNRTGGAAGGGNNTVRPGTIMEFAGTVAPEGTLMCDGTLWPTASFPNLFAVIGYAYGGAGAQFAVPDRRARVGIGAGATYALATVGGATTHSLSVNELATHSHGVTDPGHQHGVNTYLNGGALDLISRQLTASAPGPNFTPTTNVVTGITIDNTGNGDPFSILPPYLALNYIIQAV